MDAIILCAGLGTRMRPLTNTTPKPLIPVLGKGTLERLVDILPEEVTRVILVVNYLEDQIKAAIGNTTHGRPVTYVHQEPLDGTGGALRQAKAAVPDLSDRFLVINGDDLYAKEDIAALVKVPFGLLILETETGRDIDFCVAEGNRVVGLRAAKKGETGLINIGAYLLDHRFFDAAPAPLPGKPGEFGLPHAIPELVTKGVEITAVPATFWLPVGTPEELQKAEDVLGAA